jgi:hypothetical protein
LYELSTIDGAAPLCRHKVESLRVRPRVREQICLPHAPPTGDQREIWARTIKELAQLRPLTLAIHEEWQKPNTIRSVYRLSSTALKHYTAQDVIPHRSQRGSRRHRPLGEVESGHPAGTRFALDAVAVGKGGGEASLNGGHGTTLRQCGGGDAEATAIARLKPLPRTS